MTPPEMVVKNGYVIINGMAKMGTKENLAGADLYATVMLGLFAFIIILLMLRSIKSKESLDEQPTLLRASPGPLFRDLEIHAYLPGGVVVSDGRTIEDELREASWLSGDTEPLSYGVVANAVRLY
ncbi:unnamed protein product [Heligmosomoides polygyrus]|uniref:DUF2149 domain-containing protein n=1 Tax=Heligmosomoides polygyrus TaxID=6339 RepID=A0A183F719_HELPZ|nr:unnamed protein product [Heligmosomoides polygyrus]